MSLNWNVEKVSTEARELNTPHLTNAIWNSMAIGVPNLTAATLLEATHRTRIWETSFGAWNYIEGEDGQMVPDYLWKQLHLYVGLSTNATKMSTKQFFAKAWEHGVQHTARHIASQGITHD